MSRDHKGHKRVPWSVVPPLLCTVAALVLLVAAMRSYTGLGSLVATLATLAGAAVIAALARRTAIGSYRVAVEVHRHGPVDRDDVRYHEAGHWVVGRHLGGRGGHAVARPDGSGYVRMSFRRPLTPVEEAAYSMAGAIAEGSSVGAAADERITRAALKQLRSKDRGRARREAERLAKSVLSSRSGELKRVAESLRSGRHK